MLKMNESITSQSLYWTSQKRVLMHADHYLERMAIESRPSNGPGMMHAAVITEEDPEIHNLAC